MEKTKYTFLYTVDDCLVVGSNETIMDDIVSKLRNHIDVIDITGTNKFWGIRIEKTEDRYAIYQPKYIEKLLTKFQMEDANPVNSP